MLCTAYVYRYSANIGAPRLQHGGSRSEERLNDAAESLNWENVSNVICIRLHTRSNRIPNPKLSHLTLNARQANGRDG